jgi:hypothetical protein
MLGKFRLYNLDNGTLVVVCGACGYHLILTKELQDRVKKNTIIAEVEEEKTC